MKYEYYVVQSPIPVGGFLRLDPAYEVRKKVRGGRRDVGNIASFEYDGGAGKLRADALASDLNETEAIKTLAEVVFTDFNKIPWPWSRLATSPSRTINTTDAAGCGATPPTPKAQDDPAAKIGEGLKWNYPPLTPHFIIGSNKGFSCVPAKHDSLDSAQKEAERLAKKRLGEEFTVYKAVKTTTGQEGKPSFDVKVQAYCPEVEYNNRDRSGNPIGKRTGAWADTSWFSLKEAQEKFPLTQYREVKIEQPGEPVVTTKRYSTY